MTEEVETEWWERLTQNKKKAFKEYVRKPSDSFTEKNYYEIVSRGEKKRLFICCDGTWKNASVSDTPITNVAKFARAVSQFGNDKYGCPDLLHESGPQENNQEGEALSHFGLVRQIVYYSPGVGSLSTLPSDSIFSGATGKGLSATILGAYSFICNNFNFNSKKDEIILVGFSRGAFAARCLASFIDKVGLLRHTALPFLWMVYCTWKRWGKASGTDWHNWNKILDQQLNALEQQRYTSVRITVLAEWDPVSAMGLPLRLGHEKFSFVSREIPSVIDNAFVAVSLDEKRASFKPRLWKRKANQETVVQQCGFVGCHSDTGGGNQDIGLSTVSLLWIISRIQDKTEAQFNSQALFQFKHQFRPPRSIFKNNVHCLSSRMELRDYAAAKGTVQESYTGWWHVLSIITLGFSKRKRDYLLRGAQGEFCLHIHFTSRFLWDDLRCRSLENFRFDFSSQVQNSSASHWVSKRQPNIRIPEAPVSNTESKLFQEWSTIAKATDNKLKRKGEGSGELKDGVGDNWSKVAERLNWALERSNDKPVSLVANAMQEIKKIEEQKKKEDVRDL